MMWTRNSVISRKQVVRVTLALVIATTFWGDMLWIQSTKTTETTKTETSARRRGDLQNSSSTTKPLPTKRKAWSDVAADDVGHYSPHCPKFYNTTPPKLSFLQHDVTNFTSDYAVDYQDMMIRTGNPKFPTTRFTPHVQSIVDLVDLEGMENDCKWKFIFTVPEPYSIPTEVYCTGKARQRMVPWWCQIFHQLFYSQPYKFPFPPILPTNITLAISSDDYSDSSNKNNNNNNNNKCLASSSPNGTFAITNFLESQRMADKLVYPKLKWEDRCSTPIWRGSAWMPKNGGKIMGLENALIQSPRLRAVLFSTKLHPELLDARIADSQNGFLSPWNGHYQKLWKHNATNGLYGLLPIDWVPSNEYYSQYQTAVVLCGIGAAFRTPIHFSTMTAVLLQECHHHEWYHHKTMPLTAWKHYIPLDLELTNLQERLEWVRDNPQKVHDIAKQGRQFYEDYLSFDRNYEHFYELVYRLAELKLSQEQQQAVKD